MYFREIVLLLCSSIILARSDGVTESDVLTKSTNRLAFSLPKWLDGPNQFWSPFGISILLAMAYGGARGQTAQVMESVLGYSDSDPSIHETIRSYLQHDNAQLKMANLQLISKLDHFLPSYLDLIKEDYHGKCEEVDFQSKGSEIMDHINEWVKNTTNGKIENFLSEPLDKNTAMALLNSIYFKGTWQSPFGTLNTRNRPFYNDGEDVVLVPTMSVKRYFIYHEEPDCRVLELPYSGSPYRMVVLLPRDPKGIYDLQKRLGEESFANLVDTLKTTRKREVYLEMPKFEMEFSQSMKEPLKSFGLANLFQNESDFSGINGKKDLYVSEVIQKSKLKVTEEGTEATSGTILVFETRSMSYRVAVNHPFLLFIYDTRNSLIVFEGRVVKLTPNQTA